MPTRFSLTITKKLWILACSTITGIVGITIVCLIFERLLIIDERRDSARNEVETAYGVLVHYHSLAVQGKLPENEAKSSALAMLKTLRYGNNEYFWVNDMQAHMIMHPIKPELDGTDLTATLDPTGKHIFVEMVNTVNTNGAGFVQYLWEKPGEHEPVSKVSYVKGFSPWGWIIGSGLYMDTVNGTFWDQFAKFSYGGFILNSTLLVFNILVARSITRPLKEAVQVAKTVAQGDLTSQIAEQQPNDETGDLLRALRSMHKYLDTVVGEVRREAETIAGSASEIAAGSMDLSSRTESQASALEETAASMEDLTGTVKRNAESAVSANALAQSASDAAIKGKEVVLHVVATMDSINDSSKRVCDIIEVINTIAFQTNILALNAAVEAARAGEQGRGFAVVATEVRSLAQRSATAAKEIKVLLDASVERAEDGTKMVAEAGTAMDEIVLSIERVTNIMADISAAGSEQSLGISQINSAISEMDITTQQNATLVDETAAATSALQDQATKLTDLVSVFKLA